MRVLISVLALLLAVSGAAHAQVRTVEVRTPRAFGYFLGDLVRAQADIVVDAGFTLQAASLPQSGPLAYWLDLRDLRVEETVTGDVRRVRLFLTYQTFYAALDARALEIPGFAVTFESASAHGATTATAQVPAWSFNISPLREVVPPARENPADYMRPDGRVAALDARPLWWRAGGFGALALLAFAGLARDRAWGPFRARRGRPFGAALAQLRRLGRTPDVQDPDAEAAYGDALRALHRGLDATDGRRVLADDLPGFLARHPAYRPDAAGLAHLLSVSRLAFFGPGPAAARAALPWPQLEALARRLAAAERAA
ncbi:nonribosomal peptide synthetase MxaA [Methylobacterium sp. J-090]|uniref:nonribosomal peptide synthetase MxaA n=1 Tax=Methylobacterium sp. J-090 TaxID=2836666 RepID=UPI001FB894B8|nr:nonribosomal peptide synthetase MxaA [Methylobacterium sp. J-090]MCJ2083407.1 nonribosomal peptide synthetase MxaA [Methylobacterium sp. J-090]